MTTPARQELHRAISDARYNLCHLIGQLSGLKAEQLANGSRLTAEGIAQAMRKADEVLAAIRTADQLAFQHLWVREQKAAVSERAQKSWNTYGG